MADVAVGRALCGFAIRGRGGSVEFVMKMNEVVDMWCDEQRLEGA